MRRWVWLIALVGCYRPAEYATCDLLCGEAPGRVCPVGQTCDELGICKPEGMVGNCGTMPPDSSVQDAPPDQMLTDEICFGEPGDFFRVCVKPPQVALQASGLQILDTTTCPQEQTQSGPPAACVYAYSNVTVTVSGTLRIVGPRPAVIVATGAITIVGTVDVSSTRLGGAGAGANTGDCAIAQIGQPASSATGGAGGGAGGALAANGGSGGNGNGSSTGGGTTLPAGGTALQRIRGGCPGGAGGKAVGGFYVPGGAGGGAIFLMSKQTISMAAGARINASGAGGNAPDVRGGGGGGGSGGFIGFNANSYNFDPNAQIFAVGGAGASGGGSMLDGNGGVEATAPNPTIKTFAPAGAGLGGLGGVTDGGQGDGGADGGGGGGGGSGGLIGFDGQMALGTYAPAPRQL